jgi:AbrB family looped-hinge helix DNA binding protein
VIPKRVREALKLKPGEELHIYTVDGSIHLNRALLKLSSSILRVGSSTSRQTQKWTSSHPILKASCKFWFRLSCCTKCGKSFVSGNLKMLADAFVSEALRRQIIAVDLDVALAAATISIRYSLPMANALVYATAQSRNAQFITSDAHFGNLPGVTLI